MPLSCDYGNFGSPFDDSDADLILRAKPSQPTRENCRVVVTQFRVHKLFLSKASPVFKRLLSDARHPDTDIQLGITRDKYTNLPVLCLPEDRDTLHSLLTFIYPTDVVQPRTLKSMMKTCAAAKKYNMPSASAQFRAMAYGTRVAPVGTTKDAFRTYALAFDEGLTDEAFEAALEMLSSPQTIETYSEDLCIASGPALYALWRHRTKALKVIASGIQECITGVGDLRNWLRSSHTGNNHSSCKTLNPLPQRQFVLFTQDVTENFSNMNLPQFIETMTSKGRYNCRSCGNYLLFDFLRLFSHLEQRVNDRIGEVHRELLPLFEGSKQPATSQTVVQNFGAPFNRSDADLIIRSSDQVDFHVHQSILGMASVVFEDMFTVSGPSPREQGQDKPVVNLTEDSKTVHRLLTMLYPIERSMPKTLEDALSLLATCQKYLVDSTITHIRSLLKDHEPPLFTAQNSFHAYGIARRYRLKDEALVAARLTLERPFDFDECGEDLRFISGADIIKLWRYRAECAKVAKDCINRVEYRSEKVEHGCTHDGLSFSGPRRDRHPFSIGRYYDHFLRRVDKLSPKLITDRQALETAEGSKSDDLMRATITCIRESVRAEVEAELKSAIDEIDIDALSEEDFVSSPAI